MTHAQIAAGHATAKRWLLALVGIIFALVSVVGISGSAHADEVGTDKYDYTLKGNVQLDKDPLEGVLIKVSGNGYSAEVETDAEGRWAIGVPKDGTYKVTLVQDTLPAGVVVEGGADTVDAEFGRTKNKAVNFFLGEGERVTVSVWDQTVQRIFNGLNFGLLLALAAIGISLIFGTTGLSNFAHAEMITFGALMTFTFANVLALPLALALVIAVALSAAFGWSLDAGIWRPLRKKGVGIVQLMIVSIGLSLTLRYVFQYFYGGRTLQLPGATGGEGIKLGPITTSVIDLWSMGISVVVLLATAYFLLRTRIGKATRAVSDNPSLASASGIDVDFVIRVVWILAAALAGLAGILWAYFRPGVSWDMGFQILLLVFAAVTLGGLGTAFGALVGSLIVGLFTELSTLILPSDMKYVGALLILILVLLFRPQGILGRRERIG